MPDVLTSRQRSFNMSRIRSAGNATTELRLIGIMRAARVSGWRRNARVFGRPDFVFPIQRIALFVDGCYWHGCPRCNYRPATNRAFWIAKIAANKKRDRLVNRTLRKQGYRVIRLWEHSLRSLRIHHRLKSLLSSDPN